MEGDITERRRFFTWQEKLEHANENGGWQCDFEIERGVRCPEKGVLEAHHMDSFSKGGETEADNMLLVCLFHHAMAHLIADEPWAAKLVQKRMK